RFIHSRQADQLRTETRDDDAHAILFVSQNIEMLAVSFFLRVRRVHRAAGKRFTSPLLKREDQGEGSALPMRVSDPLTSVRSPFDGRGGMARTRRFSCPCLMGTSRALVWPL